MAGREESKIVQVFSGSVPCRLPKWQELRNSLAHWLHDDRIPEEARAAVVLATHEAAVNAIEHGRCEEIHVEARIEEDLIHLEVRADGAWKPPEPGNDERGRGMILMHRLMDSVTVDKGDHGTAVRMHRRLRG